MRAVAGLRRLVHILIVSSAALLLCGAAHAQDRIALIIGNAKYSNAPRLPNTANDAADMAAAFKKMGFTVTTVFDAGYDAMRRALLDFSRAAGRAQLAVVYFAGHGVEIGGQNYLIPVDAELKYDRDVGQESIPLRNVMEAVAVARRLGLVILDACRNDPFRSRMVQTAGVTRSVSRGLARVDATGNVLVAFAAREGMAADDGGSRNSPFTAALLSNIDTPDLDVRLVFGRVRDQVVAATKRQQEPVIYGSLGGEMIMLASLTSTTKPSPTPSSAARPVGGDTKPGDNPQFYYAAWTKFCGQGTEANAKTVCFTGNEARTETGMIAAAAVLIEPAGDAKKILRVTLPLGLLLNPGSRLVVDQQQPLTANFIACIVNGCMADYDATPDLIAKLKRGQTLSIQGINLTGEATSVPIPLAEFAKALAGPPTDPKMYEERQKKLMEELEKRADETRRRLGQQ